MRKGAKVEVPDKILVAVQAKPNTGRQRTRTIDNPNQGIEVLRKARSLTRNIQVYNTIPLLSYLKLY